jgi:hypothetical protein
MSDGNIVRKLQQGLRETLEQDIKENRTAVVALLRKAVEEDTHGRKTIREVDDALFWHHFPNDTLYLAVCDPHTPEGMILEANEIMQLWSLGDCLTKQERANAAHVAAYRKRRDRKPRDEACFAAGDQAAKSFLETLRQAVKRLGEEVEGDDGQAIQEMYVDRSADSFTLEDAARACAFAGVDFSQFVRDVLGR